MIRFSPAGPELVLRSNDLTLPDGKGGVIQTGVLNASVEIEDTESILNQCYTAGMAVYKNLKDRLSSNARGWLIRFDGFPTKDGWKIVEMNCRGPEEFAAVCASWLAMGREMGLPNPAEIIAPCLRRWAGDKEIIFLLAEAEEAVVKRAWGSALLYCLKLAGLEIREISISDFLGMDPQTLQGKAVYAFGDVVLDQSGPSHFSPETCNRLFQIQEEFGVSILNPISPPGVDFGDKVVLETALGRNPQPVRTEEDVRMAISGRQDLVLKPEIGASGNGVLLGRCTPILKWILEVYRAKRRGGYFLSRVINPKSFSINEETWVADVNPSFFFDGEFHPLGFIARAVPWAKFEETGILNVSKGGGMTFLIPPDGILTLSSRAA